MHYLPARLLIVVVVSVAAATGAAAEPTPLSWDSAKVLKVRQDYDRLLASFTEPSTKANYEERATKIADLLRNELSNRDLSDLAATCSSVPVAESNWSGFESSLITEMVWVFLKSGDRDSLVTLLSTRFPSHYHFIDIEEMLVIHGEKLKDPILMLGEAYSKCRSEDVRREIANAVRRAFTASGIRDKDDRAFVTHAMDLYELEKGRWIHNSDYDPSPFGPPSPLFVTKPKAAERSATREGP